MQSDMQESKLIPSLLIGSEFSTGEGTETFEVRAPYGGELLAT
ncbi:MAG: hypothetical protein QOD05_54, partial [Microbacteriaceae bacterium]|nr:hypothetical protein [Microbacteriaceae bacterium]